MARQQASCACVEPSTNFHFSWGLFICSVLLWAMLERLRSVHRPPDRGGGRSVLLAKRGGVVCPVYCRGLGRCVGDYNETKNQKDTCHLICADGIECRAPSANRRPGPAQGSRPACRREPPRPLSKAQNSHIARAREWRQGLMNEPSNRDAHRQYYLWTPRPPQSTPAGRRWASRAPRLPPRPARRCAAQHRKHAHARHC